MEKTISTAWLFLPLILMLLFQSNFFAQELTIKGTPIGVERKAVSQKTVRGYSQTLVVEIRNIVRGEETSRLIKVVNDLTRRGQRTLTISALRRKGKWLFNLRRNSACDGTLANFRFSRTYNTAGMGADKLLEFIRDPNSKASLEARGPDLSRSIDLNGLKNWPDDLEMPCYSLYSVRKSKKSG